MRGCTCQWRELAGGVKVSNGDPNCPDHGYLADTEVSQQYRDTVARLDADLEADRISIDQWYTDGVIARVREADRRKEAQAA